MAVGGVGEDDRAENTPAHELTYAYAHTCVCR